uniref:Uncharacterized protein n=1 Tax=Cacopsylla melanoneura TaxID=428564 RepID=A0A8D8S5N6_9HEMI
MLETKTIVLILPACMMKFPNPLTKWVFPNQFLLILTTTSGNVFLGTPNWSELGLRRHTMECVIQTYEGREGSPQTSVTAKPTLHYQESQLSLHPTYTTTRVTAKPTPY